MDVKPEKERQIERERKRQRDRKLTDRSHSTPEICGEPDTHLSAQGIKNSRLERTPTTDHTLDLLISEIRMMRFLGSKVTYQDHPAKWLVAKPRLKPSLLWAN